MFCFAFSYAESKRIELGKELLKEETDSKTQ